MAAADWAYTQQLFCLCGTPVQFFTGLTSGHFSLVPFFPLMFLWLVLYVGHIGAHKRRASFLHAYFILNVLIICFVLVSTCQKPRLLSSMSVPSSKLDTYASRSVHLVPGCPGHHPVRARWRLRRRLLVG